MPRISMIGDLLRLVRAPLAATAISNGVTGYLLTTVRLWESVEKDKPNVLTHEPLGPWQPLVAAAAAATALYWAGMALNDYFDRERDRTLAPFRPLPAGKVPAPLALGVGLLLLLLGVGAALFAGGERAAIIAAATSAAILSYDALLKRWRLPGCVAMAACRSGNVLLGASIGLAHRALGAEGATRIYLPYAAAIGIYIFSVTLLSTFETEDAPPSGLALGFLGALGVPIALGVKLPSGWPFFLALVAVAFVLAARAGASGTRKTGHATTRWLLRSLVLLDAGVIAGSGLPLRWAALVLLLLVPAIGGAALLFRKPPTPSAPPASV